MKGMTKTRICRLLPAILAAVLLMGCDAHIMEKDTSVRPGHVLCVDGSVLAYDDYATSGKEAIAVIFHTNPTGETAGNGYAVYLWDTAPKAFADSLGIEQGTSAITDAFDGNENTFAIYDTKETTSPMAETVFDMWRYGQSAFIPSVAEMRLMYSARLTINPIIEKCGGDTLPSATDECWYWTSTEVDGQQTAKARLFSMGSGVIQETPKIKSHKLRPIISIYKQ